MARYLTMFLCLLKRSKKRKDVKHTGKKARNRLPNSVRKRTGTKSRTQISPGQQGTVVPCLRVKRLAWDQCEKVCMNWVGRQGDYEDLR